MSGVLVLVLYFDFDKPDTTNRCAIVNALWFIQVHSLHHVLYWPLLGETLMVAMRFFRSLLLVVGEEGEERREKGELLMRGARASWVVGTTYGSHSSPSRPSSNAVCVPAVLLLG